MEQLFFSLNATVPVFLVMVLGYLLKIFHIVDEPFVKTLNSFNFKITLPILLFRDIATSDFYSVWDTRYVLYCFLVTLFCITVVWVCAVLFYRDKTSLGELIQASYRSSAAVLGIAFVNNMYGNSGMTPLMIIGGVPLYNVAAVLILSLTAPSETNQNNTDSIPSSKVGAAALKKALKGVLKNPIIWGILLGLFASIIKLPIPTIAGKTLNSLASLASPLALIGLGAGFQGRKALKQIKPTAIVSFVKLILWPALFIPLAIALGFTGEKLIAILIMLGAPTTPSCYIMAKNMGHEGTLTSSTVLTTTFLCSITMTVWIFLLRYLGYV